VPGHTDGSSLVSFCVNKNAKRQSYCSIFLFLLVKKVVLFTKAVKVVSAIFPLGTEI